MIMIIGLLSFGWGNFSLHKAIDKLVISLQLERIKGIEKLMQKNSLTLQALVMKKTWEEKFALLEDEKIRKIIGPSGENAKLFQKATQIAGKYNIALGEKVQLLAYFYKDKNNGVIMGMLGLDYAGINIIGMKH